MSRLALLIAFVAIVQRTTPAEACSCCGAGFSRTPIGWSADGAILLHRTDNAACEFTAALEVWTVDAERPERCYDLRADPEVEIACSEVISRTDGTARPIPRSVRKRFAKAPVRVPASRFRVKQEWTKPDAESGELAIVLDLATNGRWVRVWSGTIHAGAAKAKVSLWPNPKGDRVLVLVDYRQAGSTNQQIDAHWAASK